MSSRWHGIIWIFSSTSLLMTASFEGWFSYHDQYHSKEHSCNLQISVSKMSKDQLGSNFAHINWLCRAERNEAAMLSVDLSAKLGSSRTFIQANSSSNVTGNVTGWKVKATSGPWSDALKLAIHCALSPLFTEENVKLHLSYLLISNMTDPCVCYEDVKVHCAGFNTKCLL